MRGDIVTPWALRAKEYSWSLCVELAPRNITPTDIDYVAECNGKFAFFEMKAVGTEMPYGQELMFDRLLSGLQGDSILFVVEHTKLDRVSVPVDVVNFHCRLADKHGGMRKSETYKGTGFPIVYKGFFEWAESGEQKRLRDAFDAAKEHAGWIADYEAEERRQDAVALRAE